jgi:hypothetical protein
MKRDREAMSRNRDEERRSRDDAEIGAMYQWYTVRDLTSKQAKHNEQVLFLKKKVYDREEKR